MFNAIQFIGTQRSGSNLLRLILNQHDLISAPHPPHLLKTFVPLLPGYQSLYSSNIKCLVDDMCQWVEFNPVPWTRVKFDREKILRNSTSVYDVYEQIYMQKAEADLADIWCCKSTFNVYYVNQLEKKIKPFYIHLYRDGRDVAASFKKVIVGHKHAYHIAQQWREEQMISLKFLESIEPKRKIHVSYEFLLDNPDATIGMICSKLGIEFSSNMLRYYNSEESQHTAESGEMWEHVIEPIMKNNKGKYHNDLTHEEIKIFEKVAGDMLELLGYKCELPSDNNFVLNVDYYNLLNEKWIADKRKNAPAQELEGRVRQEKLLTEIQSRFHIMK